MDDIVRKLQSIMNKETLQDCLSYISLYIGIFESFTDILQERVEMLLCEEMEPKAGKLVYKKSETYKKLIEIRKVDNLGNKNPLKATFLWLVDSDAITNAEYEEFIVMKNHRNRITHEVINTVWNGLGEEDAQMLFSMYTLFEKIDRWWICEIEIPLAGEDVRPGYDPEGVASLSLHFYRTLLSVLYGERLNDNPDR